MPMQQATGHEQLLGSIELPDQNDRHVLAAAIVANAEVIVTYNLKDFPQDYLSSFGIEAMHPDDFVSDLIDLNHALALETVTKLRKTLKKPPISVDGFLASLSQIEMAKTVKALEEYKFIL